MTLKHPISLRPDYAGAHMKYLSDIANADVAHLIEKEKTYKGSWKKRGGIGAYMMLARKIDRLEHMASERNWDIFKDSGDGRDGTPIAEIRDLRRYLLLVESELVAQGQLPLENKHHLTEELFRSGTPDDGGHHARHQED